jgi:hypothetical protein
VPVGVTGHRTQRPRGQVGPPGPHQAQLSSSLDPGGERWPIFRPLAPLIAQLVAVLRILAPQVAAVESGVLVPPAHRGWCLVQAPRTSMGDWGFPVQGVRFGSPKSVKFGLLQEEARTKHTHTHTHTSLNALLPVNTQHTCMMHICWHMRVYAICDMRCGSWVVSQITTEISQTRKSHFSTSKHKKVLPRS